MKKIILLALLMSTSLGASAQNWVEIPDDNFAAKLNQIFPECMDGNMMDTQCLGVVNATSLDLTFGQIFELNGIEHFVSLQELNCSDNHLNYLPELPNSLTELRCANNPITELSGLPNSLTLLDASHSSLSEWWELPNSLTTLLCNFGSLTQLPELPSSLTYLNCSDNFITELPELPSSLTYLNCRWNSLTALPELPNSLIELVCSMNEITELPELPSSLNVLTCSQNELTELPELPSALTELLCDWNNLTALPELPPQLNRLLCSYNQLTCLPSLPLSLINDDFYNNFNISNNHFTCLPNYVPAMSDTVNSQWLEYPLCDLSDVINNPYGCASFEGVAGTVFDDNNVNCQQDEAESGLMNIPLRLLDDESNLLATTYTLGNNLYNFTPDAGTYTVQLVTEVVPYQPSCDDPGDQQQVILTEDEPAAYNVDFGVECLPDFDVGTLSVISTGAVFPGQQHTVKISAGDLSNWYGLECATGVSGSVTVNISGPVSYVGPADGALTPTVSGDIDLTYIIADFGDVDLDNSFKFILGTDTTAQAEDRVCIEVTVDPIDGDISPENNFYHHCYEVTNSYDPNVKEVWPQNVEPGYDGYFSYTIHFQNTGTAPAFNIRLADTLDTNLDLSTFEVTGYSHPVLTYVSGNVATFRFNNIMLPDSTSDLEGSNGYVQYRIKPDADLPVGTIIENTAHIFFDFNDAIVTNTTQNEISLFTSLKEPHKQIAQVFPNPGTGQFNVLLSGSNSGTTTHLEVYNLNGQRVLQQQVNENHVVLDLTEYPSGMYLLHVRNEHGSEAVRLVKY